MIDSIIAGLRFVLDPVLNPLLYLGQDWALIITAILEALLVVVVRKWTSPQEKLHRLMHDKAVQKHLAALAAARGDRVTAAKHKALRARISLMGLKHEALPLLFSIPAVLILAAWGYAHLPYRPAPAGSELTINLYSQKLGRAGEIVTLLPQPGAKSASGPVGVLRAVTDVKETLGLPPYCIATWNVAFDATVVSPVIPAIPPEYDPKDDERVIKPGHDEVPAVLREREYTLVFREGEREHHHALRVGGRYFESPIIAHASTADALSQQSEITTEVVLTPFKLFGWVKQPSIDMPPAAYLFGTTQVPEMPAWMFAYILIILPFYFLWKRLLKVA